MLYILIVDDLAARRAAVRARLESCPGFTVCGEAVVGLDAIEKARELKPDLILSDISIKPEGMDQVMECIRILLQLASASLQKNGVCYALFDMTQVRLRQNAFDRWIVVDAANELTAWSGSRFVPITDEGFPVSDVQVSNLDTRDSAAEYAVSFGFEVVAPTIH